MADMFATIPELAQAQAQAQPTRERAFPWIGQFFDTARAGGHGHLYAMRAHATPCNATGIDDTIVMGVEFRNITCPTCRQIVIAWPKDPGDPPVP
jgi:hypothetical protein